MFKMHARVLIRKKKFDHITHHIDHSSLFDLSVFDLSAGQPPHPRKPPPPGATFYLLPRAIELELQEDAGLRS